MRKKFLWILIALSMATSPVARAQGLTGQQKRIADTIAQITANHYDECGILPSVAVGQACNESSLGKNCIKPNNLWGIKQWNSRTEHASFEDLEDGVVGYLKVLSLDRYENARFCEDYKEQIRRIADGGYNEEPDYASNTIWEIENYGFWKYDKLIEGEEFTARYDSHIPDDEIWLDADEIKSDTVEIGGKTFSVRAVYGAGEKTAVLSDEKLSGENIKIRFI